MSTMTKRPRRIRGVSAVALVAAGLLAVPAAASAGGAWSVQPEPFEAGYLQDLAQLDEHTTWAVGDQWTAAGDRPVLVGKDDRDGRGWQVVPTPADSRDGEWFNNVDASSAGDVWAVGGSSTPGDTDVPAVHWDGTAWISADIPVPENCSTGQHVAAVAPDDAWAGGWYCVPDDSGTFLPLLRHWDGSSWTAVELPPGADFENITAVEATSATDVWALGYSSGDQPRAMHYDGSTWTPTPVPYAGVYGEFYDVAAKAPDDVWAVGRVLIDENDRGHALVMHYDGTAWRQVTAPAEAGRLGSVALTPDGIAAVGQDVSRTESLVLTGNAAGLTLRSMPDIKGTAPNLNGITVRDGAITVVGSVPTRRGSITPLIAVSPL
ncbi:hypothetical protein AB0M28_33945 [Streptomyces sp. NPDC051940]|uniref:hypothetical protein n=1 Tax=Streptomyces sp. NPDC051940 TaxID=3155675 RepID=UPI003426A8C2